MPLAFMCKFADSRLSIGSGTILTPILLLMRFEPLEVVLSEFLSKFVCSVNAAFFHHGLKNANFKRYPEDTEVSIVLSIFAVMRTKMIVFLVVKLPAKIPDIWIGVKVALVWLFILATLNSRHLSKFRQDYR